MAVGINSIATLKSLDLGTLGTILRFVEEKKAWYWGNPLSTDIADDDNVIQPTNNTGRWYKQTSKIDSNEYINWSSANSTAISASAGEGYFVDCATLGGTVTVTLPASPISGNRIGIFKEDNTDFSTNKITIDRNGNNIAGEADNYDVVWKGTNLELFYVSSSYGWAIKSTPNIYKTASTKTVTYSGTHGSSDFTTDLFSFAGKNYDDSGVWANPHTANRIEVTATNTSDSLEIMFNHSDADWCDNWSWALATGKTYENLIVIIKFKGGDCIYSQVRPTKLVLHRSYTYDFGGFQVFGSNGDVPAALGANYNNKITSSLSKSIFMPFQNCKWDLLKDTGSSSWAGATYSEMAEWDIITNTFYEYLMISLNDLDTSSSFRLVQLGLWGDLRYITS